MFLITYALELQIAEPVDFVEDNEADLLTTVREPVKTHGYILFVGVDDYDGPSKYRFFARHDDPDTHLNFPSQQAIESLVDSFFWKPLRAASDIIPKLFVTSTFPISYPFLDNFGSRKPSISPVFVSINAWSKGAPVPSATGHSLTFGLGAGIFALAPVESDVAGAVTINGLIDLLATGAVEVEGQMDAPLHADGLTITWSTLYYLGALTYDRQVEGTLRIANSVVLSLIHAGIDATILARYNISDALYFTSSATRPSARLANDTSRTFVASSSSRSVTLVEGPFDSLTRRRHARPDSRPPLDDVVRTMELRTLTLLGMWQSANANAGTKLQHLLDRLYTAWSPTKNALETLPCEVSLRRRRIPAVSGGWGCAHLDASVQLLGSKWYLLVKVTYDNAATGFPLPYNAHTSASVLPRSSTDSLTPRISRKPRLAGVACPAARGLLELTARTRISGSHTDERTAAHAPRPTCSPVRASSGRLDRLDPLRLAGTSHLRMPRHVPSRSAAGSGARKAATPRFNHCAVGGAGGYAVAMSL
ncbi:hypothetical protein B0H10DRAFT_2218492 [Mycena sp. CBHHK59/15]|nr:hypothetical protein B0H10DRAFT_2218492 [Mycena sp. CBHHK59/15]